MNKLHTIATMVGNGSKFHLTPIDGDVTLRTTLCNKVWTSQDGTDGRTLCTNCAKKRDKIEAAGLAEVVALVVETPSAEEREEYRALVNRVEYFEAKLAMVDESHAKHDHRFTMSMDHSEKCPVFTDGVINALCECWHSDAKCDERQAKFGELAEDFDFTVLPPLEIVKFNGKDYELTEWTADPYDPRNVDRDWVSLKAVDGSGAVMVQRFDLDQPEPVKAPQTPLRPEHSTSVQTPAPRASVALPKPRTAVIPTPAMLDSLNLRRHIGHEVKIQGDSGRAWIHSVLPGRGSDPGAVVVRFSDGFKIECTFAQVLLIGA